jgi:hypothetical protein
VHFPVCYSPDPCRPPLARRAVVCEVGAIEGTSLLLAGGVWGAFAALAPPVVAATLSTSCMCFTLSVEQWIQLDPDEKKRLETTSGLDIILSHATSIRPCAAWSPRAQAAKRGYAAAGCGGIGLGSILWGVGAIPAVYAVLPLASGGGVWPCPCDTGASCPVMTKGAVGTSTGGSKRGSPTTTPSGYPTRVRQ